MAKKNSEVVLTVRTSSELKKRIEKRADEMEISGSALIRIALALYLKDDENGKSKRG